MWKQNGEQVKINPVVRMFKSVWVPVRLKWGTNVSGSRNLNISPKKGRKEGRKGPQDLQQNQTGFNFIDHIFMQHASVVPASVLASRFLP